MAYKDPAKKRAAERRRRAENGDPRRAFERGWYDRNAEKLQLRRFAKLGIHPTRTMPALCELCGKPPKARILHLDHDHTTKTFRGWLCGKCNRALGLFGDSIHGLQRAIDYLNVCSLL